MMLLGDGEPHTCGCKPGTRLCRWAAYLVGNGWGHRYRLHLAATVGPQDSKRVLFAMAADRPQCVRRWERKLWKPFRDAV